MSSHQSQIFLAARIPVSLKEKLQKYCLNNGIKISYFVTEAIKERFVEILEDRRDLSEAKKRLKNTKLVSQEELNNYLSKRRIKL